jgi:uridine kinase
LLDYLPALKEFYAGAETTVDQAVRAASLEGADFVVIKLASADPNGQDASVEDCVELVRQVVAACPKPIAVEGCKNIEKDRELFEKIAEALQERGIRSQSLSMDNYYRTYNPKTSPKTPDGKDDLESPDCLDLDLLGEHLRALAAGETIHQPLYNFATRIQAGPIGKPMRLKDNEVAVCEGIHALNDDIFAHVPGAFRLYISARSNVQDEEGKMIFKGTWMRLMRRLVRDNNFRGTDAAGTLDMWANVRRGEKKYISPFKERADLKFDTAFPSEVSILKHYAEPLLEAVPEGAERYDEIRSILPALDLFEDVDPALLAPESMLREFIGGGIYHY